MSPDTLVLTMRAHARPRPDIVTSPAGHASIRQISSGEVMHSVNRPSDEAERLYVQQSGLADRLRQPAPDESELVIWDVGLGAASNAMAALHCFERACAEHGAATVRPLRLVSFEIDSRRNSRAISLTSATARRKPSLNTAAGRMPRGDSSGSCTGATSWISWRRRPCPT